MPVTELDRANSIFERILYTLPPEPERRPAKPLQKGHEVFQERQAPEREAPEQVQEYLFYLVLGLFFATDFAFSLAGADCFLPCARYPSRRAAMEGPLHPASGAGAQARQAAPEGV